MPYNETPEEAQKRKFVAVVLADTEDAWTALFAAAGRTYEKPGLVLFSGAVQSACGFAEAAVGPFYCPGDRQVYIDLSFYDELQSRFGAPGDFAQAYVVAHEVGHHVQTLLGISERNMAARQRASEEEANALSVRQELQADCFAGIWAHNADRSRQLLEAGDIEEGLNAAAAIGDDRLQKQSRGYVSPESFTHGSSQQRVQLVQARLRVGPDGVVRHIRHEKSLANRHCKLPRHSPSRELPVLSYAPQEEGRPGARAFARRYPDH